MKFDIYYKTISANEVESETKTYRCESDGEMKAKMIGFSPSEGFKRRIMMNTFNYYWRGLTAKKSNTPKQYGTSLRSKRRKKHRK